MCLAAALPTDSSACGTEAQLYNTHTRSSMRALRTGVPKPMPTVMPAELASGAPWLCTAHCVGKFLVKHWPVAVVAWASEKTACHVEQDGPPVSVEAHAHLDYKLKVWYPGSATERH